MKILEFMLTPFLFCLSACIFAVMEFFYGLGGVAILIMLAILAYGLFIYHTIDKIKEGNENGRMEYHAKCDKKHTRLSKTQTK